MKALIVKRKGWITMESIIELLYDSEKGSRTIGSGCISPEDAESDYFLEAAQKEMCKYIPNDINKQNSIDTLLSMAVEAKGQREYKRGIRFAVRFMSEAMQPPLKDLGDFMNTLEMVMK